MFQINNMTQMSCNFREQCKIVRMGGIPLMNKPNQTSPPTTSPPPGSAWACAVEVLHVLSAWIGLTDLPYGPAVQICHKAGGRAGCVWFVISQQWIDGFQPNLEWRWPMPSSSFHIQTRFVSLLREALGKLRRFYIVKRGYIREPASLPSLSWLPHILQATSLWG